MFGNLHKPTSAYKSVAIESMVATADAHQLIALLFDGAIAALSMALAEMGRGNIAGKGQSISKAIDIIENGLRASLDLNAPGDLADKLDALYDYMVRRLLHANLKNDPAALKEVSGLLLEIQGAWAQIRGQITGTASTGG